MFGISFGQLLFTIGATTLLLEPKDLRIIARAAGRLTGRAVGHILVARGQFESIMQHSQVNQVHKELQDAMAALEAIRYQIRSLSIMNPVPFTRILEGMKPPAENDAVLDGKCDTVRKPVVNTAEAHKELQDAMAALEAIRCQIRDISIMNPVPSTRILEGMKPPAENVTDAVLDGKCDTTCNSAVNTAEDLGSANTNPSRLYNEALTYERLAEAPGMKVILNGGVLPSVLPVSAESAQLLPKVDGDVTGSDIMLEAILEAEVARNAKEFFSLPENQVLKE